MRDIRACRYSLVLLMMMIWTVGKIFALQPAGESDVTVVDPWAAKEQSSSLPAGKKPHMTVQQKLAQMKAQQSLKSRDERMDAVKKAAASAARSNTKRVQPRVIHPAPLAQVGPLFSEAELNRTFRTETFNLDNFSSHTCGIRDSKPSYHIDPSTNQSVLSSPPGVRKFRIIVSSTEKYFSVFMNWLIFYYDSCPNVAHLYIICLDAGIERLLPMFGLSCAHVHHISAREGNSRLWLTRARITKALLDQGFDVLLSDADAVWLRNPFPLIERYQFSDIIGSRASFPEEVSKRLGATVCMGFLYIKAAPAAQRMWQQIVGNMQRQRDPDDQRTVNSMLNHLGLLYTRRPNYSNNQIAHHGRLFLDNGLKLGVTLLPHHLVRRLCDPGHLLDVFQSVVAHCLVHAKVGDSKHIAEKMYGTWALRPMWRSIRFNRTLGMSHFIDQITGTRLDKVSSKVLAKLSAMQAAPSASQPPQVIDSSSRIATSTLSEPSGAFLRGTQKGSNTAAQSADSALLLPKSTPSPQIGFDVTESFTSSHYHINGSAEGAMQIHIMDVNGANETESYNLLLDRNTTEFRVVLSAADRAMLKNLTQRSSSPRIRIRAKRAAGRADIRPGPTASMRSSGRRLVLDHGCARDYSVRSIDYCTLFDEVGDSVGPSHESSPVRGGCLYVSPYLSSEAAITAFENWMQEEYYDEVSA